MTKWWSTFSVRWGRTGHNGGLQGTREALHQVQQLPPPTHTGPTNPRYALATPYPAYYVWAQGAQLFAARPAAPPPHDTGRPTDPRCVLAPYPVYYGRAQGAQVLKHVQQLPRHAAHLLLRGALPRPHHVGKGPPLHNLLWGIRPAGGCDQHARQAAARRPVAPLRLRLQNPQDTHTCAAHRTPTICLSSPR